MPNVACATVPCASLAAAWQQHDVQELCRVLFDALEANLRGTDRVCVGQEALTPHAPWSWSITNVCLQRPAFGSGCGLVWY